MRRGLLSKVAVFGIVCTVLFSTLTIGAPQAGTIVGTIVVPEDGNERPQKLTWDGDTLWASNQNTNTVYEIAPSNGRVTDSFDTSLNMPYGIETNGSTMWILDRNYQSESQTIYEFNTNTGEQISRIPAPGDQPSGIAYDGNNLWITGYGDAGDTNISKVNPDTGKVLRSIESESINTRSGLAWGRGFLWAIGSGGKIVQIDPSTPSGEPVKEIESDYSGLAVAWDGQYLWQSSQFNYSIARVDPGPIGQTNNAPNASFTYSPKSATAGNQISFDASTSSDSNGFVKDYQWDFDGDDISDAQGKQASHTYDSPGSYTANLTIKDDDGVKGSVTKEIRVSVDDKDPSKNPPSTPTDSSHSARSTASINTSDAAGPSQTTSSEVETSTYSQRQTSTIFDANSSQKERGFFVNDSNFDLFGFLNNPLAVTIAGFVASIVGIMVQLLGGR